MKFFITGNSSVKEGLDLNFIAPLNSGAGNFASKGQTLQQSYLIAKNIFRLVGKDKINFVLIGLTPDILLRDENENLTTDVFDKNLKALNDYIKLCLDNGAKPIGVILPVSPSIYKESYNEVFLEFVVNFPLILTEFKRMYNDFQTIIPSDLDFSEDDFSDETHLKTFLTKILSITFALKLFNLGIFSKEDFYRMSYSYFHSLSYITNKNLFHNLLQQAFSYTLEELRHKKKIKVAFVTDHAAVWCGDKLYNLFAKNERFETTVFFCHNVESTSKDTHHDIAQFESARINVVGIFDLNEETPPQDIIFYLRPYVINAFNKSFQFNMLSPQTLLIYIPYTIAIAFSYIDDYYNMPTIRLAWKYFFEAEDSQKLFDKKCQIGVPRGIVSGHPKLDLFFGDTSKISFAWKMARPDAKKIIWAPHHSFDKNPISGDKSTFPYNYQFMYEFAKAHPEISWVVKPHPRLWTVAVETGLFPSVKAFEEYLQAWDDLPNAQVFTGAYYQDIFATSDGMIHDSISFIAEYQYTHKPMIYLLNSAQEKYSELGKKILDVSYIVDGKNHEEISAAIQKYFIEGNDPLKDARQKVFDEELNYYRRNGMDASDFIFKTITDELEIKI